MIDGEAILAPIGHQACGLHAAMRLHLGAKLAFDDDVGLAEALRRHRRASRLRLGPRTLPCCGKGAPASVPPAKLSPCTGPLKHLRRVGFAGLLDVDHKGQRLVVDFDRERARLRRPPASPPRSRQRDRRHTAHAAGAVASRRSVSTARPTTGDHMHRTYVRGGAAPRCVSIDRIARMRMRRAQQARMQHAGQLDVDGEGRGAGHFGAGIDARDRFANERELRVRWQRRRLVDRNLALIVRQRHAGDADRIILRAICRRHGQPFPFVPARASRRCTCG